MLHRTAKLTPFGRRLLVERIVIEGWQPAIAAETVGVSRATAYKWLRRYRAMTYTRPGELATTFAALNIRHLRTRPRRAQTNGASEFGPPSTRSLGTTTSRRAVSGQ